LDSYRAFGVAGFAHLVGDFAVAIWDPSRVRLLLVRDHLGRRPLYYHVTRERVIWSSRARPLLDAAALSAAIDEAYIATFVANQPSERTPFRDVEIVPAGHALVVDEETAAIERYWSFDPARQIRYRSDGEYEEHFVELFREAVACRLPADGAVFCEL